MPHPLPAFDAEQRRAIELLRSGQRFLLAGHVRPDGDCLGAQGALAHVLHRLGKEVVVLNPDPPAPQFDFFVRTGPFHVYRGGPLPAHDVCVLLDINELSRCGALAEPLAREPSRKMVIDHHLSHGKPWWDAAFVDVKAAATGLLVWRIARGLGVELDLVAASAVFAAIVTDTGWFRYSNTDAETLSVCASLLERGVRPAEVFRAIFQREDASQPAAIGSLLATVDYHAEGRLVVVERDLASDERLPLQASDVVLDILRSVASVEVVLFLKELEPREIKVSARSKSSYDVNALMRRFGGGGHAKASGATIQGTLADVKARLVAAAVEGFSALSEQRSAP